MTRIKPIAVLLTLSLLCAHAIAQIAAKPIKFEFRAINVAQVVQLIYGEALSAPYVIDPEVMNDPRLVSFRYSNDKGDLRSFIGTFLGSLGYAIETKNGIDLITKQRQDAASQPVESASFIYRPAYRDVHYLARILSPVFHGSFSVNRSVAGSPLSNDKPVPEGSATAMLDQSADVLVFTGTNNEIDKLKKLLPQVDFQFGEVAVRGVVYEVSTTNKDGSAFGLLAAALGSKLQVGVGDINPAGSFIRLKNTAVDVVFAALSQDSRFKVMSSPSMRIRSGSQGTFSVGQDVPVLGSVSYAAGGQPVQSVEYRSSGVIFNVFPTVREGVIDLSIDQQLSNFIPTTSGVNNSPTLTKRAMKTSVGLQDGDLIVLGGLTETKASEVSNKPSFLPRLFHSSTKDDTRNEILLVLQVQRI